MPAPKTPLISADAIVEHQNSLVLIERKNPPYGLALPGGFIEIGEDVKTAVLRELKEETGLDAKVKAMLGVYSDPKRDPRGHVITLVFICESEDISKLKGGDDAKRAFLIEIEKIPFEKLVFDHSQIIKDYLEWKKNPKVFVR